MIELKDIKGNVIYSVPITQTSKKVEELMKDDYIQLSWNSESKDELPIASYIEHNGEIYRLLEPYNPTQKDELEFTYTPQFKSRVMAWGKVPFFFYSNDGNKVSREPDWTLTSNPADFMKCVCDAILNETGETWTYTVDASLPASVSLSFNSVDILSALNNIASAFETEWYVDKANNIIHLEKASFGEPVTLEVGINIKTPSVNNTKEGYYTRFYAFGSTRNITQNYEGANVNNLVNKRLTLDPVKYPNGYKDIREGLSEGEIYSKILIFEDVYPSSKLSISGVRNRLMYTVDESGNKVQIGTDESGNPIYDQYAIWFFRIEDFEFDNNNIIEGYKPHVSFQSGALNGREFEIKYYDKDTQISTSDGTTFDVKAGDYEIFFVEEGSYIIPSLTGLIPSDGDNVVLFNIKMPNEYTQSAYNELESRLNEEMERLQSNLNNYSFKSNPVAFNENNPALSIGRNVTYVNRDYSYTTRVIKLETQLDFPAEQNITIGNEKIKGNTQQLKEEVAVANKDLNLLSVFNEMTNSIQQSYSRTQQMILDGFAAIKDIWQIKKDGNGVQYAFSKFNVVTQYGLTTYADNGELNLPSIFQSLPIDEDTLVRDEDGVLMVNPDIELGGGGASTWEELEGKPSWIGASKPTYTYSEILNTPDLSVYATQTWVGNQGYATQTWVGNNYLPKTGGTLTGSLRLQNGNYGTTLYFGDSSYCYISEPSDDRMTIYASSGITLSSNSTITMSCSGLSINGGSLNYSSSTWTMTGNLAVTGGLTFYSDIRKKTKIKDVELTLDQIADAPLIEHYYNDDKSKTTHVSSIAQYWAETIGNDWFCKKDSEGYYTMEIQNCALASAISIAREFRGYKQETESVMREMEDCIRELKKEVESLKEKL